MAGMPTRPRGMGRLFRRGDTGNWQFWLDGRRVRTPYADKKAAEVWRRTYLAETASGKSRIGAENATVGDLLDLVERDYRRASKSSEATMLSRVSRLRERLGSIRLLDLRDEVFDGYVDDRLREGRRLQSGKTKPIAPATVNRELEVLRRALNLGARQTPPLIAHVPRIVTLDESNNVRTQTIDHPTYQRLCAALPDAERWLTVLGYHMGWRLGRLLELTWGRVDFEDGVIYAPDRQREGKQVGTAPIYGDMQTVLVEARRSADGVRAATVVHRPDGAPVVDIRKAWARATRAAGCAGVRFHDLRACPVSNLIDAGVPQLDAMKISGHQTDSMIGRYRIVSPKQLRSIGERVEAYLKGKNSREHPIQ